MSGLYDNDARQADPLWRGAWILRCLHHSTRERLAELDGRRAIRVNVRRWNERLAAENRLDKIMAEIELDDAQASEEGKFAVKRMLGDMAFQRALNTLTQGGRIGIVVEERDCDCVYSKSARILNAKPATVRAYMNRREEQAEGPIYMNLVAPSGLRGVEPERSDLVLEAFEDGHRHTVYSPIG